MRRHPIFLVPTILWGCGQVGVPLPMELDGLHLEWKRGCDAPLGATFDLVVREENDVARIRPGVTFEVAGWRVENLGALMPNEVACDAPVEEFYTGAWIAISDEVCLDCT